VRASLAGAAGHARLPASVWVSDPAQWQLGAVAAQVDLVSASTSLAATHYLLLRTIRLTPPPLPPAQGASTGTAVLSPTTQMGVTVVMTNDGTSDEPAATVRFTLTDQATGSTATKSETTAIAYGASVTLPTATFGVQPGTTYVLSVSVVPPAGQTDLTGTTIQQPLEVAPSN
jgi:hypothetical protein